MKDYKKVCKDYNLNNYQAHKGADVMGSVIKKDVFGIINDELAKDKPTIDSLAEEIKKYFDE